MTRRRAILAERRTARGSAQVRRPHYAYAGEVELLAARLWRGQTINFRSVGGGFAPMFVLRGALAARRRRLGIAEAGRQTIANSPPYA
jgi:hypothetical protein